MENNNINELVNHLLETAEFEPIVVFDRCLVVMAKLENGVILAKAQVADTPEEFNPDQMAEDCLKMIYDDVVAMVSPAPVPAPSPLTEEQAKTIVALAENGMKVTEAAKVLGCARSTMVNRLQKIKEVTDKDPMIFYDLCQLLLDARILLGEEPAGEEA